MSRQSKNSKKILLAKQFSETRKSGGSGPSKTQPLHEKLNELNKLKSLNDLIEQSKTKTYGYR